MRLLDFVILVFNDGIFHVDEDSAFCVLGLIVIITFYRHIDNIKPLFVFIVYMIIVPISMINNFFFLIEGCRALDIEQGSEHESLIGRIINDICEGLADNSDQKVHEHH